MRNKLLSRRYLVVVAVVLMLASVPVQAGTRIHHDGWSLSGFPSKTCHIGDIRIEMHDRDIMITHEDYDYEQVECTEEFELIIDGRLVDLDPDQQELVKEFYDLYSDMYLRAKSIGKEGVAIGIEGAKLGIKAIGRVLKMAFTDYDEDDLERDMEREAEAIEAKAEILEDRAEALEDMADELQDLLYEMSDEIPELNALDWF